MIISKATVGESLVFLPDGRLDALTGAKVQDELLALINSSDTPKHIVIDFAKLTYISSAGMRVLLVAQKAAAAQNKLLTICNVSEGIKELLDMVGFLGILPLQESPQN